MVQAVEQVRQLVVAPEVVRQGFVALGVVRGLVLAPRELVDLAVLGVGLPEWARLVGPLESVVAFWCVAVLALVIVLSVLLPESAVLVVGVWGGSLSVVGPLVLVVVEPLSVVALLVAPVV